MNTLFRTGPDLFDLLADPRRRVPDDFRTYAHLFWPSKERGPHESWLPALTYGLPWHCLGRPFARLWARMPELGSREVEALSHADFLAFARDGEWMS